MKAKGLILVLPFVFAFSSARATECEAAIKKSNFNSVELRLTSSSNSVQAILWNALYQLRKESQVYSDAIQSSGSTLLLQDQNSLVSCQSQSAGMLPLQLYRCEFSQVEMNWTTSSLSVPALLYTALGQKDMGGVRRNGNELVLEDEVSQLTCTSASAGALTVQMYRCILTIMR